MYKVFVYARFNDAFLGSFSASDSSLFLSCLLDVLGIYNLDKVYFHFCKTDEKKK